jgi:hypothetical protein
MKKVNPHLGKTGLYMHKVSTSDFVFNATENLTDKLIDLIKTKIVPNTELSTEAISELKKFFQSHFVALTSKLLQADKLGGKKSIDSESQRKVKSITPKGQNIDMVRNYDIEISKSENDIYGDDNFNLMLNFHLENLFIVPFYLSYLAIKDRQKATEITIKEVRELQNEINDLLMFKKYFTNETDPQKILMMQILKARNDLIEKNKRIPLMKEIAAIVRPDKHKNTLNSELKSFDIKFDYKTGIFADRKTNKEIKIL